MKGTNSVLATIVQEGPGAETEEAGPGQREEYSSWSESRERSICLLCPFQRAEPVTVPATLENHGLPRSLNTPPFLNFV